MRRNLGTFLIRAIDKLKIGGVISILFLILGIIAFLLLMPRKQKMNLLIISVDALRKDAIGAYGYPENTTPHIDQLAEKSFVFHNVYTIAPVTFPSFLALMTGSDQTQTRVFNNTYVKPEGIYESVRPTLAEILKKNGYKTTAFVTNRFLFEDIGPLGKGFDKYYQIDEITIPRREQYNALIERANFWLSNYNDNKSPFFLWVHLMEPHNPYNPPEEYRCVFNKKFCKEIQSRNEIENESERKSLEGFQPNPIPKEKVEYFRTLYDGEVAKSDGFIGLLLDSLKKNKLDKSTVVVVLSDHGEGFDHNYYFKHSESLYNSSISIPLIIHDPASKLTKKKDIAGLYANTDIYNSLLELLGLPQRSEKKSDSFVKELSTECARQREEKKVFSIDKEKSKIALIKGKYKYIYSEDNTTILHSYSEELYNLADDPDETVNIAGLEEMKTIKKEMKKYTEDKLYSLSSENPSDTVNEDLIEKLKSMGY